MFAKSISVHPDDLNRTLKQDCISSFTLMKMVTRFTPPSTGSNASFGDTVRQSCRAFESDSSRTTCALSGTVFGIGYSVHTLCSFSIQDDLVKCAVLTYSADGQHVCYI